MSKSRKFTFLCVPQDGGNSKSFSIATKFIRRGIILSLFLVIAFLLAFTFLLLYYFEHDADTQKLSAVQGRFETTKKQLEEYRSQVKALKAIPIPEKFGKRALPKLTGLEEVPLGIDGIKAAEIPGGLMQVQFRLT
ncbi:hypothetical protein ACFLRA_03505, partial [Bdellovibrionota bacterium]